MVPLPVHGRLVAPIALPVYFAVDLTCRAYDGAAAFTEQGFDLRVNSIALRIGAKNVTLSFTLVGGNQMASGAVSLRDFHLFGDVAEDDPVLEYFLSTNAVERIEEMKRFLSLGEKEPVKPLSSVNFTQRGGTTSKL